MSVGEYKKLPEVARIALAAHFGRQAPPAIPKSGSSKPVFVTLRNKDGSLRGCIGHLTAQMDSLESEVSVCALAAAFRDPRFPELMAYELKDLKIEISVLEPSEEVKRLTDLDPKVYGVIVTCGQRRGVLLPDIEGVDSVEKQLAITRQKAGIAPYEEVLISRFRVTKVTADD